MFLDVFIFLQIFKFALDFVSHSVLSISTSQEFFSVSYCATVASVVSLNHPNISLLFFGEISKLMPILRNFHGRKPKIMSFNCDSRENVQKFLSYCYRDIKRKLQNLTNISSL